MSRNTSYLWVAALTLGCCVLLVVATNLVVDPYGFYRWFNAPGFNTIKPRAGQQIVRNKAHGIVFRKPNAIILGNSRSEIGFDPHAAAWPPGMRVFNSGIPGGGTQTAVQFMEFALKQGDVKLAVIGIDFLDFLANPTSASPESNNTSGRSISMDLALIHISEPTRQAEISYAVFCLKKK